MSVTLLLVTSNTPTTHTCTSQTPTIQIVLEPRCRLKADYLCVLVLCMSMCAHVTVHVRRIAQITQRHCFLYDSQLCGLGALVGHSTAKNVWCATLLESPSYPHTLKHTLTNTYAPHLLRHPTPLSRRREGPHPKTKNGSNSTADRKKTLNSEGKVEELMSTFVTPSLHPPHFHHASIVVDGGGVSTVVRETSFLSMLWPVTAANHCLAL